MIVILIRFCKKTPNKNKTYRKEITKDLENKMQVDSLFNKELKNTVKRSEILYRDIPEYHKGNETNKFIDFYVYF